MAGWCDGGRLREQPGAPISPFACLKVSGSAVEQQSCARNWLTHRVPAATRAAGDLGFEHCPGHRARLRLGYLSANFRDHVVGRLLVDLTGYTEGSRREVLLLRPAPLQVSWRGDPGTLGAPFVDAVFCDPVLVPHSHQPRYDEPIVHLAHGYQPGPAARAAGVPGPMSTAQRVALGRPAQGVV